MGQEETESEGSPSQGKAESKSRLRALPDRLYDTLELLSEAFFTLDDEFCFGYLNRAAEDLLGRSRNELVGRCIWDEFPEAVGTASDFGYRKALREQVTVRFVQHYPPLGKWFEAEAHAVPDGLAVYFRDITERQVRTERLKEQAALLDAANDAIFVMGLDYRIQYWNKGAEVIYGRTSADVIGKPAPDVLVTTAVAFAKACEEIDEKGAFVGETVHRHASGNEIIAHCRWSVVLDDEKKPEKILAIHSDVTQTKKLESQFLRIQRMESIGALAGGIAHDLNNTLSPILLAVSLMDTDTLTEEQLDSLSTIETCTRRGAHMVQQLLAFARGGGDQRKAISLVPLAKELEKIMRDTFPKKIHVRVTVASELGEVEADATQLHQVLTNLCVNARDAMPEGGNLTVHFDSLFVDDQYAKMNMEAHVGPYVVVTIEDTGVGIPREIMDRIFEPFFTTKEINQGTGLGLSTSHAIVRNHGGFLRVYSEPSKGTMFKVYLPAVAVAGDRQEEDQKRATHPRGKGELILVVDDEAPIRQIVQRTLERYGYRVLLAANGAEAIALYAQKREEISLVLTDMTMPIMDGPSTVASLRVLNPAVKIVGASGLGTNGNVARALQNGMSNFVAKPYTTEALLTKIRQVLDEPVGLTT